MGFHVYGPGWSVRPVRALDADQQFHRGDRGDGSVVGAEDRVYVQFAALDRDEDACVEDYSPGHPRTSSLKADRRSA